MSDKESGAKRGRYENDFCDPPEKIAMCLACKRPECVNCFRAEELKRYGKKKL